MLLVRQTGLHDCGIAVAAMIANVSRETVLDRLITGLSSENALSTIVMWRVLQDITQSEWQMNEMREPWTVGAYQFSDTPAAVLVQRACLSRHYIAVLGNLIYDPLLDKPLAQSEYPDANAWVVTVFTAKADDMPNKAEHLTAAGIT